MAIIDSLLHCLHLGRNKSWLDKEFVHRYCLCRDENVKEIRINYTTKEFMDEAINSLAQSFTFVTTESGALSVESYLLVLRVKPSAHLTDFDDVDYNPSQTTLFNRTTGQPILEEERKRFTWKKCMLRDAIYQMFMRKDEQEEGVHQQISSYLDSGWTLHERNTGHAIEFLREGTQWKCRHCQPQTIRFSIGDHEYETTTTHQFDSYALFEAMKSLVQSMAK